jgi:hypothetical protein
LIPPVIPIPNINFPKEDGSEPPLIEQPDGSGGFVTDIGPTQEYESPQEQQEQQEDILGGDASLDNIIDTTLPKDVVDPIESEEIIKDFKKQLVMGGTKCE